MRDILAAGVLLFASIGVSAQEIVVLTPEQVAALPALPWQRVCSTPVKDPQEVSLVQLIANPDRFEGRPVTVIGYFHLGFEHSALYLNKDDYQNDIRPNSLWVDSTRPIEINDGYVLATGIFTQTLKGHLGAWPGSICNVTDIAKWPGHEH